jgi:hypothetical protein
LERRDHRCAQDVGLGSSACGRAPSQTTPSTCAHTATTARNKAIDANANASSATARTMMSLPSPLGTNREHSSLIVPKSRGAARATKSAIRGKPDEVDETLSAVKVAPSRVAAKEIEPHTDVTYKWLGGFTRTSSSGGIASGLSQSGQCVCSPPYWISVRAPGKWRHPDTRLGTIEGVFGCDLGLSERV